MFVAGFTESKRIPLQIAVEFLAIQNSVIALSPAVQKRAWRRSLAISSKPTSGPEPISGLRGIQFSMSVIAWCRQSSLPFSVALTI
jgi:hypothetical protein